VFVQRGCAKWRALVITNWLLILISLPVQRRTIYQQRSSGLLALVNAHRHQRKQQQLIEFTSAECMAVNDEDNHVEKGLHPVTKAN